MNVHVYVDVCLCGGICGQGWHVFNGNLGREVHVWPVFAQVRLTWAGCFFFCVCFYIPCLYIIVLGVMLLGAA